MTAYNSKKFFYLYFLLVTIPSIIALIFLLTYTAESTDLIIMKTVAEITLATSIILMTVGIVYHHFIPTIVFEINDESLTLYRIRSQVSYKLADIRKVKVYCDRLWTVKFDIYVSGRVISEEYHTKDTNDTRVSFIEIMKSHGIEVEEYVEDTSYGD